MIRFVLLFLLYLLPFFRFVFFVCCSSSLRHSPARLDRICWASPASTFGFMVPSDFLGLAFGHLYIYSAETITIVTVCSIRRSQFLDFLDECPALEKEVLLRTCTELAAAQEQMLLLGRKSALERVASFILSMASRQRLHAGGTLELPMSRSDIADYLGLTIETVSRALGVMRRRALIAPKGPHRIAIPLPGQLEHFAGV